MQRFIWNLTNDKPDVLVEVLARLCWWQLLQCYLYFVLLVGDFIMKLNTSWSGCYGISFCPHILHRSIAFREFANNVTIRRPFSFNLLYFINHINSNNDALCIFMKFEYTNDKWGFIQLVISKLVKIITSITRFE